MNRGLLNIGTISGIPILVHLNWFVIATLVTWSLAGGYFPQKNPGLPASGYWLAGVVTALLFFSSVLLHELGHGLAALGEGVPVKSITLFIFGGVAHIAHEPHTPEAEFRIVAAGPFTSLVLSAFYALLSAAPNMDLTIRTASEYLSQINLILALFNLIPGFPLDGGRLLRAGIWRWKHNFHQATYWAVLIGLGIAGLFITAGLAFTILDHLFSGIWLAFIGWYLGRAALGHYRQEVAPEAVPPQPLSRWLFRPSEAAIGKTAAPAYEFLPAPESTGNPGKGKVQL